MEDNNYANPTANVEKAGEALPAEISVWTKVKNFLLQDITIELTPKQEKVFGEVYDFWHQDLSSQKVHDFLFQEISFK